MTSQATILPTGAERARELALSVRRRGRTTLVVAGVLLLGAALASVATGAVSLSVGQILAILGDRVGLDLPWAFSDTDAGVLLAIRLPRAAMGACVGAGLALSGAVLQGLFRNPLAEPTLIGISSGARLAASTWLVLGATPALAWLEPVGILALPLAAVTGAWLATLLVYRLGLEHGRVDVARMLLAGIALTALAEALGGALSYVADDAQLRAITMWRLGSLGGATWPQVSVVAAGLGLALLGARRMATDLNAMLLGEGAAATLGLDVERAKRRVVAISTIAVGVGVAFTGIIGFVGLVAPHLVRLVAGPDHRIVLPASAVLGAALVLGGDAIARTVAAPAELPLGVVTALVGAPFFLWLLRRDGGLW